MKTIIEAENFQNIGGWVIETQSIQTMGSAYLMAHGMGIPVADAVTEISLTAGRYDIWVRTRDWSSVWGRGQSAGRFTVVADGQTLPAVLGTNGDAWQWQYAGQIPLSDGVHTLSLHDLTGFNGRCDAVYLTDEGDIPEEGENFRRNIEHITVSDGGIFDFIVIGGGMAGTCMALSAIRSGVKTLLIEDRGMLGGCNSSEVRVSLGGLPHAAPYPALGNIVEEIGPIMGSGGTYPAEYYEDARKLRAFELSPRHLWQVELNTAAVAVETDGDGRITAVICRNCKTGEEKRYFAPLFADCTGDATIARLAGAKTMYGTEAEADFGESLAPKEASERVMGQSILWLSSDTGRYSSFPEVDFGVEVSEDNCLYVRGGDWEWESGQYKNQALDAEKIRDYAMMAIYANWSYLKHHSSRKAEYETRRLDWVSPIGGKRESYRVIGDVILTQRDIEEKIQYPDATAAVTWDIDLHYPDPKYLTKYPEPFRSCAYHRGIGSPYAVPYRCLYAKDVPNLFLGGRILSATHVAFGAIRVMRTLGQLGEAVGMAAAICKLHQALPRDVYTDYLDELKQRMTDGVTLPSYHAYEPRSDDQRYHIKEIGMLRIPNDLPRIYADRELTERIAALDITHENGRKLKDYYAGQTDKN